MTTIGDRIRKRRMELGLSAEELGERLGKDRATIYRYESGKIKNLPAATLEPLAAALLTTPADLLGYATVPESGQSEYYIDPETAALAQQLLTDPDYRILFDAARGSRPEDMRMAAEMLRRFKEGRSQSD